jgi:hypothetical protein
LGQRFVAKLLQMSVGRFKKCLTGFMQYKQPIGMTSTLLGRLNGRFQIMPAAIISHFLRRQAKLQQNERQFIGAAAYLHSL